MNAEQKKMYFTETAIVLNREGFHAEKILGGTLGVWLDDEPLCEVSEVGGITYRGENNGAQNRLEQIQAIIAERENKCMEYDDSIVRQMVECIKVYPGGKLEIIFGGGYLVEESV